MDFSYLFFAWLVSCKYGKEGPCYMFESVSVILNNRRVFGLTVLESNTKCIPLNIRYIKIQYIIHICV